MKNLLKYILKTFAKLILVRNKPIIIGITGSVGKTTTKDVIYSILSTRFRVRKNLKNYNNEIGLPLTVIGAESAGKSFSGWFKVFSQALSLVVARDKDYPEILILEMGIDRPGDMKYLLSIVSPRISIVTRMGHSHMEFFGSTERIKNEKGLLVKCLPSSGWAILNYDDEKTMSLANQSKAKILSYGFKEGARVRAGNISKPDLYDKNGGISFELIYNNSAYPAQIGYAIGKTAVYSALAGAATGIALGMDIKEIVNNLTTFKLPPGRMNLLKGVKGSFIIDDTYNSSPQSAIAALETMGELALHKDAEKIAVFGDMLELGSFSEEGHKEVGKKAADIKLDKLVIIGKEAELIGDGAHNAGMSESDIFLFQEPDRAAVFLKNMLREGDLVLIKGSQGARMEKVVKGIMIEPERAEELLVRQGKEWRKK